MSIKEIICNGLIIGMSVLMLAVIVYVLFEHLNYQNYYPQYSALQANVLILRL